MNVTIGMIVLNEERFIRQNLKQHYLLADQIIIVEGADRLFPKDHVTCQGLSTDRTAKSIQTFPDPDNKITFIQHGFTRASGANAKCELRDQYLQKTPDGVLVAIDADEFYRWKDFDHVISILRKDPRLDGVIVPQLHFWRNTTQFITGGYYDIPHCRFWRVRKGDQYNQNHNYPSRNNRPLIKGRVKTLRRSLIRDNQGLSCFAPPVCYHYGFTRSEREMRDKSKYYENRGEKKSRPRTYKSRSSWFSSDARLSPGLRVYKCGGLLPEVLAAGQVS